MDGLRWKIIIPADAHGEGSLVPVSPLDDGHLAPRE